MMIHRTVRVVDFPVVSVVLPKIRFHQVRESSLSHTQGNKFNVVSLFLQTVRY